MKRRERSPFGGDPSQIIDPIAWLEDAATEFERWAEGAEDDIRVVQLCKSTAASLKGIAQRWKKGLK